MGTAWERHGMCESALRSGDCISSMEEETKIINGEQDCLYTTEYYQQLRQNNLFMIGCHK
jgi:hypothetical protein